MSRILCLFLIGCNASNPDLTATSFDLTSSSPSGSSDLATSSDSPSDLASNLPPDLSAAPQIHDYGSDGSDGVDSFSGSAGNFNVTVYLPQSTGAHPAVVLASGLQQPAAAYLPYAKRLASWGIITVLRDDPGLLANSSGVATDVSYLVNTWMPAQNGDSTSKLYHHVDSSRIGLAGHSRGGQATLLAAEGDLHGKVRAWFGLDPVDSSPMANAPKARTNLAGLGIPTAFLGETTDSAGGMACAPAADNFQVLYATDSPPSVRVDALGADHTQFEDAASCSFCGLCQKGTADGATVLSYSVRYLTAFFARELLGDASVGAAFDGAGGLADVSAHRVAFATK